LSLGAALSAATGRGELHPPNNTEKERIKAMSKRQYSISEDRLRRIADFSPNP